MYWLINSHNYCHNIERSLLSLVPFTDWYCCFSCVQFFAIPWTAPHQASLSFIISWNLLRFMFIESMMLSNHLTFCHILLLLLSVFPSIKIFSNKLAFCIRWPKFWSFSFGPSSEYSELISFMIDWFDLLSVQGTLKSLLQNHNLKTATLCHSAFFMVQLSHPYLTSGETIAWTRQTFVGKMMSLLLNTLPRFVIAFLPRSKCLLISWLQSSSIVILEPKKIT